MPIRTHRGRAAVYRRLWGWPLRSPRHLGAALVGLVVLGIGIGLALPKFPGVSSASGRPPVTIHPGQPVPTASRSATEPTTSLSTVPAPTPAPAPASPQALATITAWGQAWANHPPGITPGQWLAGVQPYTTDEYLTVMNSINPANVPASAVTGPPTPVNSTVSSVEADLPTNAGPVRILAISTSSGWRVSGYTKES